MPSGQQREAIALILVTTAALLGCSQDSPEAPSTATQGESVAPSQPSPEPHSDLPVGTARGWVEADGLRSDVSVASALRVMSCADQTAMIVVVSDRPVDFTSVIDPLGPPDDLGRRIGILFSHEPDGAYAVIREHAGGHFMAARRKGPEGMGGFNGHGIHLGMAPEIFEVKEDTVHGVWSGTTDEGAFTAEGAFDLTFNAAISNAWLAGEPLNGDDSLLGDVARAYMQAEDPDAVAGLSFVSGRTDGERAVLGWTNGANEQGVVFLARSEDGEWQAQRNAKCFDMAAILGSANH